MDAHRDLERLYDEHASALFAPTGDPDATSFREALTAANRYRYGIDKLRNQLRPLYEEITRHG